MWQRKKVGSFRLCADLNVHVNDKIMTKDNPLPDMETLFHKLEGSIICVKIDFSSVYCKILLDDASQEICVINTTLDLLKLLRLPRGMKHHPECSSEQSITLSKDWLEPSVSGQRTGTWKDNT